MTVPSDRTSQTDSSDAVAHLDVLLPTKSSRSPPSACRETSHQTFVSSLAMRHMPVVSPAPNGGWVYWSSARRSAEPSKWRMRSSEVPSSRHESDAYAQ